MFCWLTLEERVVPEERLLEVLVLVFLLELEDLVVWATEPGAASMERTSVIVVAIVKNLLITNQF